MLAKEAALGLCNACCLAVVSFAAVCLLALQALLA